MALESYFDFAENDYDYFMKSYKAGFVANMMGAMAQGICEKYMKFLVEQYVNPENSLEEAEYGRVLHTHSLNRLMKYLDRKGISFSKEAYRQMRIIDGYYFSARYPGEDSIELDQSDIQECACAVELCRAEVTELIRRQESDKDK